MILQNADYLLNYLSIKLRYSPLDPKGPVTLRVALQHSDGHVIELAQDAIDEVLLSSVLIYLLIFSF